MTCLKIKTVAIIRYILLQRNGFLTSATVAYFLLAQLEVLQDKRSHSWDIKLPSYLLSWEILMAGTSFYGINY